MDNGDLAAALESHLLGLGATFVAVAGLDILPPRVRAGLPVGVTIGRALEPEIVAGITHGPTPAYAGEYTRVNELLEKLAGCCAAFLSERGYNCLPGKPSMSIRGNQDLASGLPHKTVATLSGAGWIGRCALLITRNWGSAVRINTVLTDAPLPVGKPQTESLCGECRKCVEVCPAGAPLGPLWRQGMARGEFFDAIACRDCARRLGLAAGSSHSICGICIASCPHTSAYLARSKKD